MASETVRMMSPADLKIIGLDTEHKEGEHPLWDSRIEEDVDEHLVKSIMLLGIIQPVKIREEGSEVYVVDGRRRVRAAREAVRQQEEAGLLVMKVPTLSEVGEDGRVVGVMLASNELRKGDSIPTKARKAMAYYGLVKDWETVAITFGVSRTTIANWRKLMEADPGLLQAVEEKKISASAAYQIASLDRDKQKEALKSMLDAAAQEAGQDPSKRAAINAVTEADAKKHRESTGERKKQPGIKRTWLKKAMKTDAYKNLPDEQQGVLEWIVSGEADRDTWYDDFQFEAEGELGTPI